MTDFVSMFLLHRNSEEARAAQRVAASTQHAADRAHARIEGLEQQVDRLTLFTVALIELLAEKGPLSEAQILAKTEEVDLRDGTADGRVGVAPPRPCSGCGRKVSARRPTCIYCGAPITPASSGEALGR